MRPRKKVLLFGFDEATLRLTAYPLGLRDFTVFRATTQDEFRGIFAAHRPAAVVFIREKKHEQPFDELSAWARELYQEVQTMLVTTNRWDTFIADVTVYGRDVAQIRQSLKILVQRKRGPKKVQRISIADEAVPA